MSPDSAPRVDREGVPLPPGVLTRIGSSRMRHAGTVYDLNFTPDGTWQQGELERRYLEGGRMQTYLGDWHSHPLGGLRPSGRDLRTACKVAATREALTGEPVTVILARVPRRWRAGTWVLIDGRFVPAHIYPLDDHSVLVRQLVGDPQ